MAIQANQPWPVIRDLIDQDQLSEAGNEGWNSIGGDFVRGKCNVEDGSYGDRVRRAYRRGRNGVR